MTDLTSRHGAGPVETADPDDQAQQRLRDRDARLAAFSMVYGTACLQLLRAHGRNEEAAQFCTALEALRQIFADGVGQERLAETLDWISSEIWSVGALSIRSRARH